MGTEWIRSVTVRGNEVYLNSKSNNDDQPFHSWHCVSLSAIYQKEGQLGLDREMIRMFSEYAQPVGHHRSIIRYRAALDSKEANQIYQYYLEKLNAAYALLSDEEKKCLYISESESVKQYHKTYRRLQDEKYTAIVKLCAESEVDRDQMLLPAGRGCWL